MDQVNRMWKRIAPISVLLFFRRQPCGRSLSRHAIGGDIFSASSKYDLLHIYIQNTHPLAECKSVTLADIQQYPFISYEECHPSSARFTTTRAPVRNPQQRGLVISVSDRAMAYSLLALGDAYVTGSGYLIQEDRRRSLVSVPITDLGQIEIGYICNPSRVLSELALEYIEWLKIITV
ncbi:MAG: LysR family transcriptional regulator substrate-binding protein [Dysosmobacter sp.]